MPTVRARLGALVELPAAPVARVSEAVAWECEFAVFDGGVAGLLLHDVLCGFVGVMRSAARCRSGRLGGTAVAHGVLATAAVARCAYGDGEFGSECQGELFPFLVFTSSLSYHLYVVFLLPPLFLTCVSVFSPLFSGFVTTHYNALSSPRTTTKLTTTRSGTSAPAQSTTPSATPTQSRACTSTRDASSPQPASPS